MKSSGICAKSIHIFINALKSIAIPKQWMPDANELPGIGSKQQDNNGCYCQTDVFVFYSRLQGNHQYNTKQGGQAGIIKERSIQFKPNVRKTPEHLHNYAHRTTPYQQENRQER